MNSDHLITGQREERVKVERAKRLRRELTAEERILWKRLHGDHLFGLHFRRQQVTYGLVVDLSCHSARMVVEVEGEMDGAESDDQAARDQRLPELGVRAVNGFGERAVNGFRERIERIGRSVIRSIRSLNPLTVPHAPAGHHRV